MSRLGKSLLMVRRPTIHLVVNAAITTCSSASRELATPAAATVKAIAAGSQQSTINNISHRTATSGATPAIIARYWIGPADASMRERSPASAARCACRPTSVAVAACRCVSSPSRVTRCCVAMLIARVTRPSRVEFVHGPVDLRNAAVEVGNGSRLRLDAGVERFDALGDAGTRRGRHADMRLDQLAEHAGGIDQREAGDERHHAPCAFSSWSGANARPAIRRSPACRLPWWRRAPSPRPDRREISRPCPRPKNRQRPSPARGPQQGQRRGWRGRVPARRQRAPARRVLRKPSWLQRRGRAAPARHRPRRSLASVSVLGLSVLASVVLAATALVARGALARRPPQRRGCVSLRGRRRLAGWSNAERLPQASPPVSACDVRHWPRRQADA